MSFITDEVNAATAAAEKVAESIIVQAVPGAAEVIKVVTEDVAPIVQQVVSGTKLETAIETAAPTLIADLGNYIAPTAAKIPKGWNWERITMLTLSAVSVVGGFFLLGFRPEMKTEGMTLLSWVLGYWFGSSYGSNRKNDLLVNAQPPANT